MADSKKYDGSQWEHSLRKLTTATADIEPTIYTDGAAITNYTIKGNTTQSGTPSPQNPVMPNGVGNKTANLCNGIFIQGSINADTGAEGTSMARVRQYYDVIEGETYSFSSNQYIRTVYGYSGTTPVISIHNYYTTQPQVDTFTISSGVNRIGICLMNSDGTSIAPSDVSMVMLNVGQPMTYEPYGYKIPISNGQQTIDIYIGDLPLLKSLDGTAVDEISNGTLTRRVDSDGSVLPAPITTQITMPSIPTTEGTNSITVDTTVQPSEFTATWTGWHDASVKEWDGSQWNE